MSQQSPAYFNSASEVDHWRLLLSLNEAGTTLLLYDFFLNLSRETLLVWPAPGSSMKILYLLTRYMPLIDIGIRMGVNFKKVPSVSACRFAYVASIWLYYLGTGVPEIMLTVRTWAVWNRDRRLGIGLLIFFVMCWVPMIPIFAIYTHSLELKVINPPGEEGGCITTQGSSIAFLCFILMLVYEAGMFVLMLIPAIRCYNASRNSRFFNVVFRDGLLYYLYLFASSLANVVVLAAATPSLKLSLVVFGRFIHPILACRAILDLREQAASMHPEYLTTVPITASEQTVEYDDRRYEPSI